MFPPAGNVIDVLAQDKKFSHLVALLKKAGMADFLQEEGPFTIFAPSNTVIISLLICIVCVGRISGKQSKIWLKIN